MATKISHKVEEYSPPPYLRNILKKYFFGASLIQNLHLYQIRARQQDWALVVESIFFNSGLLGWILQDAEIFWLCNKNYNCLHCIAEDYISTDGQSINLKVGGTDKYNIGLSLSLEI